MGRTSSWTLVALAALALGLGCAGRKHTTRAAARDELLAGVGCVTLGGCYGQPDSVGVQVAGRVMAGPTGFERPLAFVRLELYQGGRTIGTTSTDAAGSFSFRHLDHGSYQLVLDSDRHEGRAQFDLGWKTVEVVVTARPRAVR